MAKPTAKDAFEEALKYADPAKDPVMVCMLQGMIRLAKDISDLSYRLDQVQSDVRSIR